MGFFFFFFSCLGKSTFVSISKALLHNLEYLTAPASAVLVITGTERIPSPTEDELTVHVWRLT